MAHPTLRAALVALALAPLAAATAGCAVEEEFVTADGSGADSDDDLDSSADELKNEVVAAGDKLKTTTGVNFRTEARVASETLIRVLNANTQVTATGKAPINGFYQVTFNGTTGYVHGGYLARIGTAAAPSGDVVFSGTINWEGSWNFLVNCSSYSRAAGHVTFACNGNPTRNFVDNGYWVAVSGSWSRSWCGDTVSVCKGSKCVDATIIDDSVNGQGKPWEGSTKLIEALGGKPYWHNICPGDAGSVSAGNVTGVTIRMK